MKSTQPATKQLSSIQLAKSGLAISLLLVLATLAVTTSVLAAEQSAESGLVGYWKLHGDCRDYSGLGNHGINHGVKLDTGTFDGVSAYVEVPNSASLRFGTKDFTLSAWIYTEKELDDVIGDVLDMYDPAKRKGITLAVNSSGSGYAGQGDDRLVAFGIDNAHATDWEDCGHPSPTSRYISNSMLVYKGHLYAGITDAKDLKDWSHVFRYDGKQKWFDCGRVGTGKTAGVGPMVVHDNRLYVVTWTYDWTQVRTPGKFDAGRVFRYEGGTNWTDLGEPSDNRTINCAASYKGHIFVGGGPNTLGVFTLDDAGKWQASSHLPQEGDLRVFPHSMSRYNGKLYTAYPASYAFDGNDWTFTGYPAPLNTYPPLQTHSFAVYQGKLTSGTWPEARVAYYVGGTNWNEIGRVGVDGTEVNTLTVYNGKLYGGSIPRAEVCRYEGDTTWTSLKRFYSPEGWVPALPGKAKRAEYNKWSRITTLAIHDGKLFAGTASCTSTIKDTPGKDADVLGKVFSMEAGKCLSHDTDMGPGWKYVTAVRDHGRLELYIDGKQVEKSAKFNSSDYDVSTDQPLRIGLGQIDYFNGKISEVRVYNQALSASKIRKLYTQGHGG